MRMGVVGCALSLVLANVIAKLWRGEPEQQKVRLSDVTDTLERMTRFDTVGFEVITRFA